jgi:hypothetical protein
LNTPWSLCPALPADWTAFANSVRRVCIRVRPLGSVRHECNSSFPALRLLGALKLHVASCNGTAGFSSGRPPLVPGGGGGAGGEAKQGNVSCCFVGGMGVCHDFGDEPCPSVWRCVSSPLWAPCLDCTPTNAGRWLPRFDSNVTDLPSAFAGRPWGNLLDHYRSVAIPPNYKAPAWLPKTPKTMFRTCHPQGIHRQWLVHGDF